MCCLVEPSHADQGRLFQNALVDGTLVPASKDDFERLVIATPNSSYIWIQYVAFHLQSADVESARSVAARALKTIGFREENVPFIAIFPQKVLLCLLRVLRKSLMCG